MGRDIGPVCRICRREGKKLFLKGKRCETDKCAISRERNIPGEIPKKITRRTSVYSIHFREKQKLKRIYGIREKQLKKYFTQASKKKGITGEILLQLLERRLDNVIYRLGIGTSRRMARQIVSQGHILVNDKKLDIPSYLVKIGNKIKLKDKSKDKFLPQMIEKEIPPWIAFDKDKLEAQIIDMPKQIPSDISLELVVEFYSK